MPSIAELKLAGLGLDGAGEGALLIAEEFAFEQIGRHGRAIDLEEVALAASRELVDEHGRDFFAGAAFSEDEDRDVGARDQRALGLDFLHALAGSDKGGVFVEGNFFNVGLGRLLAGTLETLFDGEVDIGFSKRLEDYACGAHLRGCHNFIQFGRTGKHDDGKRRFGGMRFGKQAKRVLFGGVFDNVPVHQEQVRSRRLLEGVLEFRGFGEDGDSEAIVKDAFDVIQNCGITVENNDMWVALARSLDRRSLFRA